MLLPDKATKAVLEEVMSTMHRAKQAKTETKVEEQDKDVAFHLTLMTVPLKVVPTESVHILYPLRPPVSTRVVGQGYMAGRDDASMYMVLNVDPEPCKALRASIASQFGTDVYGESRHFHISMWQELVCEHDDQDGTDTMPLVRSLRKLLAEKSVLTFDRLVYSIRR